MPKLPLKTMKIYSAVREIREQSESPERLLVSGSDRDMITAVYEALTAVIISRTVGLPG